MTEKTHFAVAEVCFVVFKMGVIKLSKNSQKPVSFTMVYGGEEEAVIRKQITKNMFMGRETEKHGAAYNN